MSEDKLALILKKIDDNEAHLTAIETMLRKESFIVNLSNPGHCPMCGQPIKKWDELDVTLTLPFFLTNTLDISIQN